MTVQKALEALRENAEELNAPPSFLNENPSEAVRALMKSEMVQFQERTNEEWLRLIGEENNSKEAAKLILDWAADKTQASTEKSGTEEAASDPYQSLTE